MRLQTSKSKLKINWVEKKAYGEEKLSESAAVDEIAGKDDRPLLILRDVGTPDEKIERLLQQTLKSERIQLASDWFLCVKVPERAADENHPWSELFDKRRPERLLVITRDGDHKIGFLGHDRQRCDWSGFARVLRKEYKRNATRAVKEINQLLSKYDAIDNRKKTVQAQLERSKESQDKRKIKKYEEKLAELEQDLKKALKQEEKLRDLGLRRALKRKKADKS